MISLNGLRLDRHASELRHAIAKPHHFCNKQPLQGCKALRVSALQWVCGVKQKAETYPPTSAV
eukprot:2536682-Amphidinium_carterae.1